MHARSRWLWVPVSAETGGQVRRIDVDAGEVGADVRGTRQPWREGIDHLDAIEAAFDFDGRLSPDVPPEAAHPVVVDGTP